MDHARLILLTAAFLSSIGLPCRADSVPNDLISNPDQSLRWAPEATFIRELDRLAPPGSCEFKAVPPNGSQDEFAQSMTVERAEIQAALDELTKSRQLERAKTQSLDRSFHDDEVDATFAAFKSARDEIEDLRAHGHDGPLRFDLITPRGFPAEFAEYLQGLGEFYSHNAVAARARWERMLSWPEADRKHRSVWAAYMIAKCWLMSRDRIDAGTRAKNAVIWFRKTRELAKAGFSDPLGLAASSLAWEASAELKVPAEIPPGPGGALLVPQSIGSDRAAHIFRGIGLYLQAYAAGQPHADEALQQLCGTLLAKQPEMLTELTRDEQSSDLLTAFVLARGGKLGKAPKPEQVKRWLDAVKSASAQPPAGPSLAERLGTDRMLWACYLYELDPRTAAEWRSRSAGRPMSDWIWAKIRLADGPSHMNEAAALLAHAAAGFPPQEVWLDCRGGSYDDQHRHVLVPHDRVNAELGVLRLACGQYDQALDLLLRAGWWEDAAYIAECVLTPEELAHYVDANWPASLVGPNAPLWTENAVADSRRCEKIRGLLARRLMRLDRWKEARPYFPPANQAILDSYVAAIRDGHNADRSDDDRADSCLLAARLARIHGSELFEHDSEPSRGGYETASGRRQYFAITIVASREHPIPNTSLGATPDEINRATRYAPKRYSRVEISLIAAGHAWSAAALMPDESDETARVLCTAGNWIIANDAKTAAPFYRALIGRCSTTDLGRQAAKINGLPRVP